MGCVPVVVFVYELQSKLIVRSPAIVSLPVAKSCYCEIAIAKCYCECDQVEVRACAACCAFKLLRNRYTQDLLTPQRWQELAWTLCDEVHATLNMYSLLCNLMVC